MTGPVNTTPTDLRLKRIQAAARSLFRFVVDRVDTPGEAGLYASLLRHDLTETERTYLVGLLIETFPPDIAAEVCRTWFKARGIPSLQLMDDPTLDAEFWANGANAKEIDAYAVACFGKMSRDRRRQFLKWCQGKMS